MPLVAADFPWLSIITFAPLVGAAFILLSQQFKDDRKPELSAIIAKRLALLTTGLVFGLTTFVYFHEFNQSQDGFQLVEQLGWIGNGISYKLGVDGISVLFVFLTAFIMPICVLASWSSVSHRVPEYMIAFLVLETAIIGVFTALDLVLFYIYFEASLIPMFLIIGI